MFVVIWTTTAAIDRWVTCETIEEARAVYAEVRARGTTLTASITAVVESTDYSPTPVTAQWA